MCFPEGNQFSEQVQFARAGVLELGRRAAAGTAGGRAHAAHGDGPHAWGAERDRVRPHRRQVCRRRRGALARVRSPPPAACFHCLHSVQLTNIE